MLILFVSLVLFLAAQFTEGGQNIARGARTKQSSTWKQIYTSDRAVDGNRGKRFFGDTCTHTDCNDHNPWWTVCLKQMYEIHSVTIHNPDEARGRLKNIRIDVFTKDPSTPGAIPQICATVTSAAVADGLAMTFTCPAYVKGRYIRISKRTRAPWWGRQRCDALLLCEVEVNGTATMQNCPAGFIKNQESCYHFSTVGVRTWFEAREACQAIGGDLAVVDNETEHTFITTQLMSAARHGQNFYAGLSRMADGTTWRWIDPNAPGNIPQTQPNTGPGFSDWDANQGNRANMLCMQYVFNAAQNQYHWNDVVCTNGPPVLTQYICEISATFPPPPVAQCF